MYETPIQKSDSLEERRLLTEVNNLLLHRQPDGSYPSHVLAGIHANLALKTQEDSMSNAVSRSFQPVGERESASGEKRRTFLWKGLGKTALQVAESGFQYHWSEAAHKRVQLEVREAERSERELTPGIAQLFISPRMSASDAPIEVAKDEHLADDDAVRIGYAVTNEAGEVVGRQTVSLLVSDVPLAAWVEWLKDQNNIFNCAFDFDDEDSALSVMALFDRLDVPVELLPEGPVTIVDQVKNYIADPYVRTSVEQQLKGFREDQQCLREEADRTADKWLPFETALADSVYEKKWTSPVRQFVMVHQNQWPAEVRALIKEHQDGADFNTHLASELERAWQKVNLAETAVFVGDRKALSRLSSDEIVILQQEVAFVRTLEQAGWDPSEVMMHRSQLQRQLAVANIATGNGCSGSNQFRFNRSIDAPPDTLADSRPPEINDQADPLNSNEDRIGEKHRAVCRTEGCPSRPGETEVGGCDVCLKHCQPLYDRGHDPAAIFGRFVETVEQASDASKTDLLSLFKIKHTKIKQAETVPA